MCSEPCEPEKASIDGESYCKPTNQRCTIPLCRKLRQFNNFQFVIITLYLPFQLLLFRFTAAFSCVLNVDVRKGVTWMSVSWTNPREVGSADSPGYLILLKEVDKQNNCLSFWRVIGQGKNFTASELQLKNVKINFSSYLREFVLSKTHLANAHHWQMQYTLCIA